MKQKDYLSLSFTGIIFMKEQNFCLNFNKNFHNKTSKFATQTEKNLQGDN